EHAHPKFAQLVLDARHLAEQYRRIPDVPIRADVKAVGMVGLTGRYAFLAPFARAVLCQAAVQHSPDDLRIAAFLGTRPLDDWAWLKWLPHTRGGGSLLGWDTKGRQALSRWLLDELTSRKRMLEEAGNFNRDGSAPPNFPWLLLFLDDLRLTHVDAAVRMAVVDGPKLHVAILGLANDVASVPGGSRGVAVLDDRGDGLVAYAR